MNNFVLEAAIYGIRKLGTDKYDRIPDSLRITPIDRSSLYGPRRPANDPVPDSIANPPLRGGENTFVPGHGTVVWVVKQRPDLWSKEWHAARHESYTHPSGEPRQGARSSTANHNKRLFSRESARE